MEGDEPYRRKTWLKKLRMLPQEAKAEQLQRWVPDEYMHIRDALKVLGKEEIAGWNGTELDARWFELPPDKPWLWSNYKKVERFFLFAENDEIIECAEPEAEAWWLRVEPTLIDEWLAEKSAVERWFDCVTIMRNRLSNKTYTACVLENDGMFFELPVSEWIRENGSTMLFSGVADFKMPGTYQAFPINGPVLLKKGFLASGQIKPAYQLPDFARFPYIKFLLEAASSNLFVGNKRVEKKLIEHWLDQNWPKELGIPTQTKIATLATYLRRPEDEKGGLKGKGPER